MVQKRRNWVSMGLDVEQEHLIAATRRRRVIVAVAAGAAIVLVPALVIGALGLFSGDDPVAGSTTITVSTTTVATTTGDTTTSTATPLVQVPDVVGLTALDATDLLQGAGFAVEASGDPNDLAVVADQQPAAGSEVEPGTVVRIEIAPYAPACREDWDPELPPPAPGEVEITLLFDCANETDQPNVTTPVIRRVPETADPIRATLEALLAGPTPEERAAGLHSFFSDQSAGALSSLELRDGLAVVDFNERIVINNASTSTGSQFFLAELSANLFQFGEIERIEFRVDGRCEAFWNWLQRECFVMTRDGLSDELPFGSCTAAGSSAPSPDQVEDLPEATARTKALLLSLATRCDLESLEVLALQSGTSIVLSHLDLGDAPISTLEVTRQGAPTAALVETLAYPFASHRDDYVEVFVWPAVAVPGFDWSGLGASETADLSARYGEELVMLSIDGGTWAGLSVEIDDTGRWLSFGMPLT